MQSAAIQVLRGVSRRAAPALAAQTAMLRVRKEVTLFIHCLQERDIYIFSAITGIQHF